MSEKRERGEGSLRLRGAKWWCQYYHRGRQIRVSCKTNDEKKAEKFLSKKLAEVLTGTHSDARNIRYEDLRRSYLADYEANQRRSLRHDGEGNPHLDSVDRLDSFFSGWKASEINADAIRQFQREQKALGLSNATVNRSTSALRRMFRLAVQDDRLRILPYFPMLEESAARSDFIERQDYEKLFTALPDYLRLPLAVGYLTGMRRAEILGLKWDRVDLLQNTITLRAGQTKNGRGRVVPIVPALRVLLVNQYGKRQPGCDYVCFRLDRKGHAMKIGSFRKVWQARCVKLGLGRMEQATDSVTGTPLFEKRPDRPKAKPKPKMVYSGLVFHALRRSCVRNLVRSQVPEKVAMGITGHLTRSVFDRYNIVSESDIMEAGRKLALFHENGDKTGTAMHQNAAVSSVVS
jgi:integrase